MEAIDQPAAFYIIKTMPARHENKNFPKAILEFKLT